MKRVRHRHKRCSRPNPRVDAGRSGSVRAAVVPFGLLLGDKTDKLLRDEAYLDGQLYRAMDELERLQRQRRGETVPPPLNINLGRGR